MRQEGHPIQAAVASRTDEPKWAYICMEHLLIEDGTTIASCFESRDLIEISYGDKTQHLQRLHKTTGIPYVDMCFFDNEHSNIKTVSKSLPAVKCVYTPDGMTRQAWESAKAMFGL
jgi:magnesium-dependent phosphatase 1